ncbi:lipopolysaccharide-induced tumor necrosis factor-alpha factor homolog isoform X2 [Lycorma delicatula]
MSSETAALISSEKTPLISAPEAIEGSALPKNHGSVEQPEPVITSPLFNPAHGNSSPSDLGSHPQLITCPHCGRHIKTTVKYRANIDNTWISLLFLLFCWPCMCLPFFCQSLKVANHYCSNCNKFLGRYKLSQ